MNITNTTTSDLSSLSEDQAIAYAEEFLSAFRSYRQPRYDIREDRLDKGWGHVVMHVLRDDEEVFSYERTYHIFGKETCRPFPQYDFVDHQWHDYLLFSEDYVRASVLNLETGERADEPYPVDAQGNEHPGIGFCPTGFKVFSLVDEYAGPSSMDPRDGAIAYWQSIVDEGSHSRILDLLSYSGVFALESGCVWGDDLSAKLRHIDMSRIRDGVLSTDERYGYFELGVPIDDVEYSCGHIYAPRLTVLDVRDGRVIE
jgi:hypothetical protein